MRNLKKVLALVLALAMVMTMFAGAISFDAIEFVDADSITTDAGKDAAAVLSALDIFVGDALVDPAINGQNVVTREEMAKVAFLLKTGNEDIAFYNTAAAAFSDNNSWGKAYVAWAALNGVLAGDGKGSVRPTDGVTGVEAAKIILTVLGYDAAANGLVGANWKANTMTLAANTGILANVKGDMESGLSRENVMILAKNALYTNVKGGKTLLATAFNMTEINAVAVANKSFGLGMNWAADAASVYTVDVAAGLAQYIATGNANLSVFAYRDYVATSAANNAGTFSYKAIVANVATKFADLGTEYRLLVEGLDSVVYNSYDVRDVIVIGESASQTIKNGFVADGVVALPTAPNSVYVNAKVMSDANTYANKAANTAPYIAKDNNQDGKYDFVWVAQYKHTSVANVAADGAITLAGDAANKSATFKSGAYVLVNGDVAKGDQVFYYADGDTTYIKKLDAVSGNITGYYGSETYGINGTKYVISNLATARAKSFFANQEYALNNTNYTFIVDVAGAKAYVVDVLVNTNTKYADYAILVDYSVNDLGSNGIMTMPYVKLFTADNQYKVFTVASINGLMANTYNNDYTIALMQLLETSDEALVSYVVDGNSVHLTTAGYGATYAANVGDALGVVGSIYDDSMALAFDTAINMWKMGTAGYLADTNGATVFAKSATSDWKAYAKDEFYGYASEGRGEILYYWNAYGSVVVKAMALTLDKAPANVLGANGSIVIANGAATYVYENGVYTYTLPVVGVNGAEAASITYKSKVVTSSYFQKGQVYKINVDAEGFLVSFEFVQTTTPATDVENYITTTKASVEQFYIDAFGKMVVAINDGTSTNYVKFADDAAIYTVTKLGESTFATYDLYRLLNDFAGISATQNVEIYAIYDAAGIITTAIINIA